MCVCVCVCVCVWSSSALSLEEDPAHWENSNLWIIESWDALTQENSFMHNMHAATHSQLVLLYMLQLDDTHKVNEERNKITEIEKWTHGYSCYSWYSCLSLAIDIFVFYCGSAMRWSVGVYIILYISRVLGVSVCLPSLLSFTATSTLWPFQPCC